MDLTPEDKIQTVEIGGPLWARMPGFPMWPARRCSAYEEALMKSSKSTKVKQVLVLFLGTRCDKAWILEGSVSQFTAETLHDKFLPKKFKGDRDYRAAVIEATRLVQRTGAVFEPSFLELLQTYQHDYPLVLEAATSCAECGGSCLSGQLLACHTCSSRMLHWHCFLRAEEGAWMCNQCCEIQRLPRGSVVPFEAGPTDSSVDAASTLPIATASATTSAPRSRPNKPAIASRTASSDRSEGSLIKKMSAALGGGIESHTAPVIPSVSNGKANSSKLNTQSVNISAKEPYTPPRASHINAPFTSATSTPDNAIRAADASGIDDQCFVCGMGGHLLLCDFPRCTRAYHQVCVARIFPESLDSIIGATEEAVHSREGGAPLNANPLAEPWFCPSHTCVGCHALQSTASRVTAVDMPVTLLAQQLYAVHCSLRANQHTNFTTSAATSTLLHTSNPANSTTPVYKPQASHTRNTLRQKALRVCSTCPFAVCGDCEEVLGGGCGVLQQRRFADTLECLNCASRDPRVKLARLLEKAWVRSANTRLALPFLRPLLPVSGTSGGGGDSAAPPLLGLPALYGAVDSSDGNESSTSSSGAIISSGDSSSGMDETHLSLTPAKATSSLTATPHTANTRTGRHKRHKGPVESLPAPSADCVGNYFDEANQNKANTTNTTANSAAVRSLPILTSLVNMFTKPLNTAANTHAVSDTSITNSATNGTSTTYNNNTSIINTNTNSNKRTRDTSHNKNTNLINLTPTISHEAFKPTPRPVDLLGVLEKVHRLEYAAVAEYYADLNFIRHLLHTRIEVVTSAHNDNTLIPHATSRNNTNSIAMSFDTVVDESYAFLTPKLLQTQSYEARIADATLAGSNSSSSSSSGVSVVGSGSEGMEVVSCDSGGEGSAHLPTSSNTINTNTTTNTNPVVASVRFSRHQASAAAISLTHSTADSAAAAASMLRLWRVECAFTVPSAVLSAILHGTLALRATGDVRTGTTRATRIGYNLPFAISPRSVPSWHYFLEAGVFPQQHRGRQDPYSMAPIVQREERAFKLNNSTSSGGSGWAVREMLYGCGDSEFAKYATNEMEAANLMIGMTHSQQRESLTLFDGAPATVEHHSRHPLYYGGNNDDPREQLVADDSLLILDRLREVTQKAVQLEERLRQQHLVQRRTLLHADSNTITIGQASVLAELKLANDNLRWRLEQKSSVVIAQQNIITGLQRQLAESRGERSGHGSGNGDTTNMK